MSSYTKYKYNNRTQNTRKMKKKYKKNKRRKEKIKHIRNQVRIAYDLTISSIYAK